MKKIRQDKELEQKIAREHDAQKKSNPNKSNKSNKPKNNLELLTELEESPLELLQSKKREEVDEKISKSNQKKQLKLTSALAKKGANYSKKPAKKMMNDFAEEISSNSYLVGGVVICVIFAVVVIFYVRIFLQ